MAPPTPAPSPAKVCIVCKQDCSGRPRNKDEQGRYTCQDCAKKLATAGASAGGSAPAAAPKPVVKVAAASGAVARTASGAQAAGRAGGVDDGIYKLAADPLPAYMFDEKPVELTAEQEMCQNCGHVMKKSHVICIKCGHNKQNHKTLHTVLKRPEIIKEKTGKHGSSLGSFQLWLDSWPALVTPLVGIAFLVLAFVGKSNDDEMLMGVGLIGSGVYCLAASIFVVIAAFMDSVWWGLGTFLPIVGLYWLFTQCEITFVRYTYVTAWLMSLVIRIAF